MCNYPQGDSPIVGYSLSVTLGHRGLRVLSSLEGEESSVDERSEQRKGGARSLGGLAPPTTREDERVEFWHEWAGHSYDRMVFYLDKARRCYLDGNLKPYGISSAHMPVLTYLWEGHDGDTQSVIAETINVDPATVTRVAQRLEELGYLKRVMSDRDSRALCLSLTETGWELADPARAISSAWTDEITAHLSPRRRQEILRALQRITVRAQEACACMKDSDCGDESDV